MTLERPNITLGRQLVFLHVLQRVFSELLEELVTRQMSVSRPQSEAVNTKKILTSKVLLNFLVLKYIVGRS